MEQQIIANGGLQNVPQIAGQYVYLDFDGGLTNYRNETLGIDCQISVIDSQISLDRQNFIIDSLNSQYGENGIYFTNIAPSDVSEYSTIFFGMPEGLPENNDIFGLSETIDANNQIKNDNAFVFFDHRADDNQIISVINHELDHIIFGENHMVDRGEDIFDYAASGYMLNTRWGQGSPYNKYCPVDPVTGKRCITGCTNTAAAQIIYYWLENDLLDLQLTVNSGDNYSSYSQYTGATIYISSSESSAARYDFLSFSKLNNKLANFSVNSTDSIAALCFAAGIVQNANYSSEATGTAWSTDLFIRAGFDNTVKYYGPGSSCIYSESYGYGLTNTGWNLLCSELLAGRPVAVSIYSADGDRTVGRHAIVADGYNSSTGKIHLNFGWSGSSDGWYSRYELDECFMVYQLLVGIAPEQVPFLKVQSMSVSSNNVNQKDTVTIRFSVTNTGTDYSAATRALIYSGNKLIGSIAVDEISAQGTRSYSCTIDASDLNLGENTVTVKITTQESGKISSQSAVVNVENALPDLEIREFSTSVSENDVTVSFRIANTGKTSTPQSVAKITLGEESYNVNIPILQSNYWTDVITRTFYGVSAGQHTIAVSADSENDVEEADENNNLISKTVSITAAPDFVPWKESSWDDKIVTSIVTGTHKSANIITADDDIYIDFGAMNIGKASSDSLRVDVYIDGKFFDYSLCVMGLGRGETEVWNDINIGKLSAGTHTITVETRNSRANGTAEASTANNRYSKTITVAPGAPPQTEVDLAIVEGREGMFQFKTFKGLNVWESTTPIYDMSDIYMQAFIKNIGAESAGSFTVSVLVDGNAVKSYACPSIGYQVDIWNDYDFDHEHYFGSEAYIYGTVMHIWDCHLGKLSAGTHTITVVVDSMNAIRELDETNNSYSQTLTVLPTPELPNLLITDVWLENSDGKVPNWDKDDPDSDYKLDYGADATLKFTIKNIGNGAAGESKTSLHWGVNYEEFEIAALAPGESKTYSLELPYLFYSTNNFYFNVNCDNAIQEVIEYDNEYRRWCEYGKYNSAGDKYIPFEFVDLITTHASLSVAGENVSQCLDSENITVDFTIENIGSEDYVSESVNVDILVDGVRILRKSISGELDDYIDAITFKPTWDRVYDFYFDQDEFVPYEYHFDIGTLTAGEHVISIVVDPDNESNDTVRANNRCDVLINVEKSPDTVAPVMGNVTSSVSGQNAEISWNPASDNEGIAFYRVVLGDMEYNTAENSLIIKNAPVGTSYYQVTAYDISGNASQTQSGTFHIDSSDLLVSVSDIRQYISNGNVNAEMSFKVTNQGKLSAGGTKLYIMLDGDFYQSIDVPALAVGQSADLKYSFPVTVFDQSSHYITLLSDGENVILEENESNNAAVLIFENVVQADQKLVKWTTIEGASGYVVEYSMNDFEQCLKVYSSGSQLDISGLPAGTYRWRYSALGTEQWIYGRSITAAASNKGQYFNSNHDGNSDIFFADPHGLWETAYAAKHLGTLNGWQGTGEEILIGGKNKFSDIFKGSTDSNVLVLTDDANGDALFVEDIYTAFGKDAARLTQIDEIRAGAGDDIVDMTSQKFAYAGDGVKIYGGLGNDIIWANNGNNTLFGDAGDDRIVGGSDDDVIIGGIGNDSMHGGGGDDIFCFGGDWGNDTVEQLTGGSVTLWFESGSASNWNATTLTYTDGSNSVKVSGVDTVTLKFGADASLPDGCFADAASEKIFEDSSTPFFADCIYSFRIDL